MRNTSEESREFEMITKQTRVMMTKASHKDTKTSPNRNAGTVVQCINLTHVWHLGNVARSDYSNHFEWYAGTTTDQHEK